MWIKRDMQSHRVDVVVWVGIGGAAGGSGDPYGVWKRDLAESGDAYGAIEAVCHVVLESGGGGDGWVCCKDVVGRLSGKCKSVEHGILWERVLQ